MEAKICGTPRQIASMVLVLTIVWASGAWNDLNAQNKACALATADELQSVLGAKVSGMKGQSVGSDAELCMGETPSHRVLLRLAKGSDQKGDKEAKGIAMAKQMGAQVEVKTFGSITCSTLVPPASLQQAGYNTTCTVYKNGQVGGVEITSKAQKDMVPIEKLRPLAEKIASRF